MSDAGTIPDRPGARPAPPGAPPPADPPASSPSPNRRALGIAIVVVIGLMVVVAIATGGSPDPGGSTFPPVGATTGTAGGAAQTTRSDLGRALQAKGLLLEDTSRPFRPAEAAVLAAAPRIVVRVVLPDDPEGAFIVIYELANPAAAQAAANEQASYVASGPGKVQFPSDARFVIRVAGSTVVFFSWSPAGSTDERVTLVGEALGTIGTAVAISG